MDEQPFHIEIPIIDRSTGNPEQSSPSRDVQGEAAENIMGEGADEAAAGEGSGANGSVSGNASSGVGGGESGSAGGNASRSEGGESGGEGGNASGGEGGNASRSAGGNASGGKGGWEASSGKCSSASSQASGMKASNRGGSEACSKVSGKIAGEATREATNKTADGGAFSELRTSEEGHLTETEVRNLRTLLTLLGPGLFQRLGKIMSNDTSFLSAAGLKEDRVFQVSAPEKFSCESTGSGPRDTGSEPPTLCIASSGGFDPRVGGGEPATQGMAQSSGPAPRSTAGQLAAEHLPDFPPLPPAVSGGLKTALMSIWNKLSVRPTEQETFDSFRRILEEIPETPYFARIFTAVAGLFPLQQVLRHNTPDQTLAVLTTVTDRFLQQLSGIAIEQRHKLLRTISKYCSELAPQYTFVSPEGDPFNNSTCERVEGSNSGNRLIRELHGFAIVRKSSGEVFRLGRALT